MIRKPELVRQNWIDPCPDCSGQRVLLRRVVGSEELASVHCVPCGRTDRVQRLHRELVFRLPLTGGEDARIDDAMLDLRLEAGPIIGRSQMVGGRVFEGRPFAFVHLDVFRAIQTAEDAAEAQGR